VARRRRTSLQPSPDPRSPETMTVTTTVTQEQIWQGPLPSPQALAQFKDLLPDAPERIFEQWEAESAHRRNYENAALKASVWRDRIGQLSAVTFAISALVLAGYALHLDKPWIAAVVGTGTIASVVGAFLYQRKGNR
jgi:uncharacterized membrane protein